MELVLQKDYCIYCHSKLYSLSNGYKKCSHCKRKFSPKKVLKDAAVISLFCQSKTALEASRLLDINYQSITSRYKLFRLLLSQYQEEDFNANKSKITEFDEYLYLESSKKRADDISGAKNFITFDYDEKIYNLLMPESDIGYTEFSKFLREHKISKVKKSENRITRFWNFFEKNIKKYKGVNSENFFYYLKEIEFKFNYDYNGQKAILQKLWLDYNF